MRFASLQAFAFCFFKLDFSRWPLLVDARKTHPPLREATKEHITSFVFRSPPAGGGA